MSEQVGERLRRQVAARAYHVCEYCLIHEDDTFWGCQVDHITSRKHGGPSDADNLAWACAVCNNNKGTDLGSLAGKTPAVGPIFPSTYRPLGGLLSTGWCSNRRAR